MLVVAVYSLAFLSTCMSQVYLHVICPQHPLLSGFTLISQTAGAKGLFLKEESQREKAVPSVPESKTTSDLYVLTQAVGRDTAERHLIGRVQSTCLPICSWSTKRFALRP